MNEGKKEKTWRSRSQEQKNNIDLGGFVATNMQTSTGGVWLSLRRGCQEKEIETGGGGGGGEGGLVCSFGGEQESGGPCAFLTFKHAESAFGLLAA